MAPSSFHGMVAFRLVVVKSRFIWHCVNVGKTEIVKRIMLFCKTLPISLNSSSNSIFMKIKIV